jgi:hypothetical protein
VGVTNLRPTGNPNGSEWDGANGSSSLVDDYTIAFGTSLGIRSGHDPAGRTATQAQSSSGASPRLARKKGGMGIAGPAHSSDPARSVTTINGSLRQAFLNRLPLKPRLFRTALPSVSCPQDDGPYRRLKDHSRSGLI